VRDEGDQVEERGESGEGGCYFCVDLYTISISKLLGKRVGKGKYPFPIAVFMLLVRSMQIHAIKSADREREDELYEAEDGVRDVGDGHFEAFEDAHFGCLLGGFLSRGCRWYRRFRCCRIACWRGN
jgi:hypothetical protein